VKLQEIVRAMAGQQVAVLGDLICDRFIHGSVDRISPEAPVPVLRTLRHEYAAGGAANVAHNLAQLGGRAEVFGVVGSDFGSRMLLKRLESTGAGLGGVVTVEDRPTTVKTRLVAQSQQLLRFDEEVTDPIAEAVQDRLLAGLRAAAENCRILILSDYDKGVLTERLAQGAIALFRRAGKRVVCDPKPANLHNFVGVSLLTPNRQEALLAAGITRVEADSLEIAARILRETVESEAVAITAGADGVYLLAGEEFTHLPAEQVEVYDVVGAGDTVCAVMALALAAGADYREAAALANYAGAVVVGKLGLATVTAAELLARMGTAG